MQDKTIKNILIIFLIIILFYILQTLASILLPLVLAFLFALVFQPIVLFLQKRKIPDFLVLPIISIISLIIIYSLFSVIFNTVSEIISMKDYLLERLDLRISEIINFINNSTGYNLNHQILQKQISDILNKDFIASTAANLAQGVGSFTGAFIMFALYYLVLLSGLSHSKNYIIYIGKDRATSLLKNYEKIQKSIFSYFIIKTLINLGAAIVVIIICNLFGIKFSLLWGLLTFILHFIPNFGSILSVFFPVLMGFIEFEDPINIIYLLISLIIPIFLIGNLVEPKIMGNRLRLNTITVIFGLVFWGYIWGAAGMILSVPLMVLIKIILEQFPDFSLFARIMGYPENK